MHQHLTLSSCHNKTWSRNAIPPPQLLAPNFNYFWRSRDTRALGRSIVISNTFTFRVHHNGHRRGHHGHQEALSHGRLVGFFASMGVGSLKKEKMAADHKSGAEKCDVIFPTCGTRAQVDHYTCALRRTNMTTSQSRRCPFYPASLHFQVHMVHAQCSRYPTFNQHVSKKALEIKGFPEPRTKATA